MISGRWLTARSFERGQELVGAVNTLAIHNKLLVAGVDDSARLAAVRQARDVLLAFLERFEAIIALAERDASNVAFGADPRLGSLVQKFLSQRKDVPHRSRLFAIPLDELRRLVSSDDMQDRARLADCLRGLRSLLEEHAHADALGLLGTI